MIEIEVSYSDPEYIEANSSRIFYAFETFYLKSLDYEFSFQLCEDEQTSRMKLALWNIFKSDLPITKEIINQSFKKYFVDSYDEAIAKYPSEFSIFCDYIENGIKLLKETNKILHDPKLGLSTLSFRLWLKYKFEVVVKKGKGVSRDRFFMEDQEIEEGKKMLEEICEYYKTLGSSQKKDKTHEKQNEDEMKMLLLKKTL